MRDPLREAGRWVKQAEVDLEAARHLADRFAALACFHAQRAAEKALAHASEFLAEPPGG